MPERPWKIPHRPVSSGCGFSRSAGAGPARRGQLLPRPPVASTRGSGTSPGHGCSVLLEVSFHGLRVVASQEALEALQNLAGGGLCRSCDSSFSPGLGPPASPDQPAKVRVARGLLLGPPPASEAGGRVLQQEPPADMLWASAPSGGGDAPTAGLSLTAGSQMAVASWG